MQITLHYNNVPRQACLTCVGTLWSSNGVCGQRPVAGYLYRNIPTIVGPTSEVQGYRWSISTIKGFREREREMECIHLLTRRFFLPN